MPESQNPDFAVILRNHKLQTYLFWIFAQGHITVHYKVLTLETF